MLDIDVDLSADMGIDIEHDRLAMNMNILCGFPDQAEEEMSHLTVSSTELSIDRHWLY